MNFIPFVTHEITSIVCMVLMTLGGIGFLVWDDISETIKLGIKEKYTFSRVIKKLNLHTKLVLILQLALVIIGTFVFLMCEYNNPNTIANFSFGEKFLISLFHSVSVRSAGVTSLNLALFNDVTKIIMIGLMFIGGAPGGMAGGIKTTTLLILILGVITNIRGRKNINILKRTVTDGTFFKAVSVVLMAIVWVVFCNIFLVANSDIYVLDLLFETVAAFSTVGLTSGALMEMNVICQSVIVLLMYIGRVGTTTMAVAFVMAKPKEKDLVVYSKENVIVG